VHDNSKVELNQVGLTVFSVRDFCIFGVGTMQDSNLFFPQDLNDRQIDTIAIAIRLWCDEVKVNPRSHAALAAIEHAIAVVAGNGKSMNSQDLLVALVRQFPSQLLATPRQA
jgi:hypothetical protein